jgi:hypothetical protein
MTHKVNDLTPGIAETLPDTTSRRDAARTDERPRVSAGRAGVSRGQDRLCGGPSCHSDEPSAQFVPPVSR